MLKCKCGNVIHAHNANRGITLCMKCLNRKRNKESALTSNLKAFVAGASLGLIVFGFIEIGVYIGRSL